MKIIIWILATGLSLSAHAATLHWRGAMTSGDVTAEQNGQRHYQLTTTQGYHQVAVQELPHLPVVRSENSLFDGLWALALQELQQDHITAVTDPSFAPQKCDCFTTGELWNFIWTRDTSYSVHLALAFLDPIRARDSLLYKISPRRDGTRPEIIQDTGSGGSWPVSTDRIVWATAAWELLKFLDGLERTQFRDQAYTAIRNSLSSDRTVAFDPVDGLYRGETSFMDWRDQTYPSGTQFNILPIAQSKALSTNVLHYNALKIASALARERGELIQSGEFATQANQLKQAVQRVFWLPHEGLFSYLKLNQVALKKFDLLGESLAVMSGIADSQQSQEILNHYPRVEAGAPVIWPQQPGVAVYHNRSIWPFVTAYALRAARATRNVAAIESDMLTLIRGTALSLSNMEVFDFLTLSPTEPILSSKRQLWSVAAYLSFVVEGVFGVEVNSHGLRLKPLIPEKIREAFFPQSHDLTLSHLPYRGHLLNLTLHFPPPQSAPGFYEAKSIRLNGLWIDPKVTIPAQALLALNQIDIDLQFTPSQAQVPLVADTDSAHLFAPFEPQVIRLANHKLEFSANNPTPVTFNIYRDGILRAAHVDQLFWVEPESGVTGCYTIEAEAKDSGLISHHSQPICNWSSVQEIPIQQPDWGRPNEQLQVPFQPTASGRHIFEIIYSNIFDLGQGVTAGVKQLEVIDDRGETVARGAIVMPHSSGPRESTSVEATLEARRTYTLRVSDLLNMSYFKFFESYIEQGGKTGPHNRVDVHALRITRR